MTDQVDGTAGLVDTALTIEQAARRLGVSERTIRRRIKQGTIAADKVPTAQGYEWRVNLAGVAVQPDTPATRHRDKVDGSPVQLAGTAPPAAPEVIKALEIVDELRRDNAALASRNEQLAGQVGFLQARVQEQERTIARLMAPRGEPAVEPPIAQTPATTDARNEAEAAPRRPWWQRAIRRLAGGSGS